MRTFSIVPLLAAASFLWAAGLMGLPSAPPMSPPDPPRPAAALVTVIADGEARQSEVAPGGTVADALEALGIVLSPLDRTAPSPSTRVRDGLVIQVTRVQKRREVEVASIPSRTLLLADPARPAGYSKVLEWGEDGLARRETVVWEKDGEVTKREQVSHKVIKPVRHTVVVRGTMGLTNRGGDWRHPRTMIATGYDPGPRSCGRYASGRTATGAIARKGVVAVDDRVIPMGARLYIPGYGFAVAADRGSAIKGNRIDLCFDSYREAMRWGRRKVQVYLLD